MRGRLLILVMSAVLLGAGCTGQAPKLPRLPSLGGSAGAPKEQLAPAAAAILLTSGSRIVIQPTVLGTGEQFFKEKRTVVTVDVWKPQDKGDISWTRSEKRETEASRQAREDFAKRLTPTPIGVKSPTPPEPVYETATTTGRLIVQNLRNSQSNFLPAFWPAGAYEVADNGVLFLSRDVFASLRGTKRSPWHPGIFENPVKAALGLSEDVVSALAALKEKLQGKKELETIVADDDFSAYRLRVDGAEKEVQAFTARDAAAEYVILDNPANPVILKVTVNPISAGVLDVLTPAGLIKAFAGYAVTEIDL